MRAKFQTANKKGKKYLDQIPYVKLGPQTRQKITNLDPRPHSALDLLASGACSALGATSLYPDAIQNRDILHSAEAP